MPSESADHQQQQRRGAGGQSKLSAMLTPPQQEQEHLPCPRCDSTNTKFCYYNNYNFSQPRHFCKSCRRYWTQGGTLRDIPVGGGSRKNAKRSRTCASYTAVSPASASGSAVATATIPGGGATSSAELLGAAGPVFVYNGMGGMQLGCDVNGNNGNLYGGTILPAGGSFGTLLGNQGNATAAAAAAAAAGFLALGGGRHGFGLGLGLGHGFEDVGFAKGVWPFSEVGFDGGHGGVSIGGNGNGGVGNIGSNTWQLENTDTSFIGADCFPWPELAISTPGNAFK